MCHVTGWICTHLAVKQQGCEVFSEAHCSIKILRALMEECGNYQCHG